MLLAFATAASSKPAIGPVQLPADFEFTASIHAEGYELGEFYRWYDDTIVRSRGADAYGLALANLKLGLVKQDPAHVVNARALFALNRHRAISAAERRLSEIGLNYADMILEGRYREGALEGLRVEPVEMRKFAPRTREFTRITIGRSAIRVKRNSRIKVQVDRVTRDWLQAVNIASAPWDLSLERLGKSHEGKKVTELVGLTGSEVIPVSGTLVKRFGWDWYAPDAEGTYRFQISEDKVLNFPSTLLVDDKTAVINDTHGISAIAWDALDADLAIGCGDHPGKMDAAYYLAERGVNVYVPTDRHIDMLIGTRTKGTVIGSAPVKKDGDGAVIGAQPITFAVDEPIVVSYSAAKYPLQYYDTPFRYFKTLAAYSGAPLDVQPVEITEYGRADVVVARARERKARLIGIRVTSAVEHDAVAAWLREDARHRAVLFHSAVYPRGYRLFFDFPRQTSFGDIHPEFH